MKFFHVWQVRIFLACVLGIFVAGCGEQSDRPAEKAGKAIDEAIENTTDSVSDAMKSTGDAITGAAEDAKDAMSDAMDSTGDAIKKAAENTGEAINDAGDSAADAVGLKE